MTIQNNADEDAFIEGFHDVPSAAEITGMSFMRIGSELSNCKPGSAKYLVLENALLRHKDAVNREAAKFGATVSAISAIVGTIVGVVLTAILS